MGGGIAFEMYRKMPEIFRGMVFVSTGAVLPVSSVVFDLLAKDFDSLCELAVKLSYSSSASQSVRDLAVEQLRETGKELVTEDFRICSNFDYTADCKNLDLPVLVIANSKDKMVPLDVSRSLEEACPTARLEVIESEGHMPHVESHERVNQLLKEFIEGIDTC